MTSLGSRRGVSTEKTTNGSSRSFAGSVNRIFLEEDELARAEFEWRFVGEEEPSPS